MILEKPDLSPIVLSVIDDGHTRVFPKTPIHFDLQASGSRIKVSNEKYGISTSADTRDELQERINDLLISSWEYYSKHRPLNMTPKAAFVAHTILQEFSTDEQK